MKLYLVHLTGLIQPRLVQANNESEARLWVYQAYKNTCAILRMEPMPYDFFQVEELP